MDTQNHRKKQRGAVSLTTVSDSRGGEASSPAPCRKSSTALFSLAVNKTQSLRARDTNFEKFSYYFVFIKMEALIFLASSKP